MATAAPSSSSTPSNTVGAADPKLDLTKQLRSHEVAIAELNGLPSSRIVYQRNGNLFFRTTIQKATVMEQKELDSAKAKLRNLNCSS